MLGRVRRTSRVDVGLAMSFTGIAYLIWVLVVGVTRHLVNELSHAQYVGWTGDFPGVTKWLWNSFIHAAPVFDLVGVLWLLLSLGLIVGASRQRWSISCPWVCAICQTMAATLLAVWASLAAQTPHNVMTSYIQGPPFPTTGWTSLCVALAIALIMWVTSLVWMISERAQLMRGPKLRDGMRTHIPG
ncbi:MAG: hypothetical protein SVV80_02205 [Planctomycetota bacterium]|nr:hypothetical protein [Planctomycetota bacterium]